MTNEPGKESVYPPCKSACPIQTDVREYVQLIAERRFEEALISIRRQNPLPRACGRICTHPCETACKRGQVDEPIAIAALKRFAADGPWKEHCKQVLSDKPSGEKVAVIGSGPGGLAAAHDLALLGYEVTIFEALSVLGGMLRVGVPEYRLPKKVLEEEIETIVDLGVEVKTGVRVGSEIKIADLFEQGYKAVFVAIGAHKDRKLGIQGEDDLEGVVSAVSFLRGVNQGEQLDAGNRVAVIGGGNTAIDSARSLLRMGAKEVHLVYRRSRDEMPAAQEEIEEAIHEGVNLSYLTSPLEIIGNDGKVAALKCIKNELGDPDASGRRAPKPVAGSEFTLNVDRVVAAIGQAPDASLLAEELDAAGPGGRVSVANDTLVTNREGVFAGGDAVTGPATAIKAIAAGKQAAVSIDAYLKKESLRTALQAQSVAEKRLPPAVAEETRRFPRAGKISLPVDERIRCFDEVDSVFSEERAVNEAVRCLHCQLGARVDHEKCVSCLTCVRVCPLGIPAADKMGEINIDSFACQACGMCVLECPVRAIDIQLDSRAKVSKDIENAISEAKCSRPLIVGFFDLHGNFTSSDLESMVQEYPNVLPLMVFGSRRIDTSDILKAFECGADGVLLARCPEKIDPFPGARNRVEKRVAYAKELLEAMGLAPGRLAICDMPEEGIGHRESIKGLIQEIGNLG